MRTNERTLLASLGFSDPDKKEREHDLACRYLIQPDIIERIVMEVVGADALPLSERVDFEDIRPEPGGTNGGNIESVLLAARGQLIGFIDAVAFTTRTWTGYRHTYTGVDRTMRASFGYPSQKLEIGIEVKIQPTFLSDVVRQINLYRSYASCNAWLLATRYALTAVDRASLANERIHHVRLAAGFDQYMAHLNQVEDAASPEF